MKNNILILLLFFILLCKENSQSGKITIGNVSIETYNLSLNKKNEIRKECFDFLKKSALLKYDEKNSKRKLKVSIAYKNAFSVVILEIEEKWEPSSIVVRKECENGEDSIKECFIAGAKELESAIKVKFSSDEELIKILKKEKKSILKYAVRETGERRLKTSLPTIFQLIKKIPEKDFLLPAIGALGLIGDEKAIKPLIPFVDNDDFEIAEAAVYALGDIGGEEARRYLSLIAIQNKSSYIQKIAKDILENLEKK